MFIMVANVQLCCDSLQAGSHFLSECASGNGEVGFELRHRATLPFVCLLQERPFLLGTERRGVTIQRSDGAISAHISRGLGVNPKTICSRRGIIPFGRQPSVEKLGFAYLAGPVDLASLTKSRA